MAKRKAEAHVQILTFFLWVNCLNKGTRFQKEVEKLGWTLTVKPDFRRRDCVLYYEDSLAIEAKKGNTIVQVEAIGEIRIYGKRNRTRFVFKYGKPDGELTAYLRKCGQWENNNWFEFIVYKDGKSTDYYRDVEYTILEAARQFLEMLEEIDSVEQPLNTVTVSLI